LFEGSGLRFAPLTGYGTRGVPTTVLRGSFEGPRSAGVNALRGTHSPVNNLARIANWIAEPLRAAGPGALPVWAQRDRAKVCSTGSEMHGDQSAWPMVRFGVIKDAWGLYKQHPFVWSLATLIVIALHGLVNGALFAVLNRGEPLGPGGFRLFLPSGHPVSLIASTVVSGFLLGGMIRMANRQIRGGKPSLEDLFSITDCWFDLLLVAFLIGVALAIGFALLVLPGFLVFGLVMLAIPLVVEGRLPATGAIMQSWNALKSQWLNAAVFHWVLFILAGSGFILCCIGLLVTGPLYALSVAILYHNFFDWGPLPAAKKHTDPFPEV
jgi:hypothetical protein